ncbi:MAG: enoyl-CoA hydratase family protein [Pseudomonadales bacterium]
MPVRSHVENYVAEVCMDFPKVNALNIQETLEVASELTTLGQRDDVRVILLTAAGKYFCVGADVKELNSDATLIGACNHGFYTMFAAVYDCQVPVISVVQGHCLGGGIGLAGASDMVFAAEDALFGLPEVKVGALGGATHLMRLVGVQKTRYCMYTGEPLTAAEVASHGSLHAVLPKEELLPAAREIAEKIAANSPDGVRLAKEALNGIEGKDINKCYRWEQGFTLELYTSPESSAARAAQVESGFKK